MRRWAFEVPDAGPVTGPRVDPELAHEQLRVSFRLDSVQRVALCDDVPVVPSLELDDVDGFGPVVRDLAGITPAEVEMCELDEAAEVCRAFRWLGPLHAAVPGPFAPVSALNLSSDSDFPGPILPLCSLSALLLGEFADCVSKCLPKVPLCLRHLLAASTLFAGHCTGLLPHLFYE